MLNANAKELKLLELLRQVVIPVVDQHDNPCKAVPDGG